MGQRHQGQILPLWVPSWALGHIRDSSWFSVTSTMRQERSNPPSWAALAINETPWWEHFSSSQCWIHIIPSTWHIVNHLCFQLIHKPLQLYVQGKQSFETRGIEVCHDVKLIRSLICASPWRMHWTKCISSKDIFLIVFSSWFTVSKRNIQLADCWISDFNAQVVH